MSAIRVAMDFLLGGGYVPIDNSWLIPPGKSPTSLEIGVVQYMIDNFGCDGFTSLTYSELTQH